MHFYCFLVKEAFTDTLPIVCNGFKSVYVSCKPEEMLVEKLMKLCSVLDMRGKPLKHILVKINMINLGLNAAEIVTNHDQLR